MAIQIHPVNQTNVFKELTNALVPYLVQRDLMARKEKQAAQQAENDNAFKTYMAYVKGEIGAEELNRVNNPTNNPIYKANFDETLKGLGYGADAIASDIKTRAVSPSVEADKFGLEERQEQPQPQNLFAFLESMQAKNDKWLNGGTDKGKWEDNFTDNITESFDDTKNVTYARIAKYLKDLSLDKPTDFRLVPKEKEADELGDKLKQAQILESEARAWALRHPRSSGGGGSAATDSVIRRRLNDLDVSYNKLLGQLKDANNENLVKSINGEMARNRAERYSLLKKLGESGSLEGVKIDTKKGGVSFDNPTLDIAAGDWEQGEQGQQEQKNTHNPLNLSPKDFQNLRLKNRVGSVVVFNNGQKIKITAQGYELLT